MKVVYLDAKSKVLPIEKGIVLALGYFDGLHIAHQYLINKTIELAKELNCLSGLLTFQPNPKLVLGKQKNEGLLTPHHLKINLLNNMGIDYLFVIRFNHDLAKMSHKDFVRKFINSLNTKHVLSGFDFKYGYKGKGNINTLFNDGNKTFGVSIIEEQKIDNEKISSSKIRELIINGEVHQVKKYLGRYYATDGIVIHGFKKGREMGFPTANISMIDNYVIPQNGVYIVFVEVFKRVYRGIANIGYNPTFSENNHKSIEVHILDFNQFIYHEKISISWIKRIRDEKKFSSVDELVKQLSLDKEKALNFAINS